MANGSGEENSGFKPVKLRLKLTLCHILLVRRGWINTYILFYTSNIFYVRR